MKMMFEKYNDSSQYLFQLSILQFQNDCMNVIQNISTHQFEKKKKLLQQIKITSVFNRKIQ